MQAPAGKAPPHLEDLAQSLERPRPLFPLLRSHAGFLQNAQGALDLNGDLARARLIAWGLANECIIACRLAYACLAV